MSLGKVINLSAGGVKVGNIESLFQDDSGKNNSDIKLSMYKNFYIVLILNSKTLVRLKANFARYEKSPSGTPLYCFKFKDVKDKDIDVISKFIIVEQINQKKLEREAKCHFTEAIKKKNRK